MFCRWDPVAPLLEQNNSILSQMHQYRANKVFTIFGSLPHGFSFFKMSLFSPVQIKLIHDNQSLTKQLRKAAFAGNTCNYTTTNNIVLTITCSYAQNFTAVSGAILMTFVPFPLQRERIPPSFTICRKPSYMFILPDFEPWT